MALLRGYGHLSEVYKEEVSASLIQVAGDKFRDPALPDIYNNEARVRQLSKNGVGNVTFCIDDPGDEIGSNGVIWGIRDPHFVAELIRKSAGNPMAKHLGERKRGQWYNMVTGTNTENGSDHVA